MRIVISALLGLTLIAAMLTGCGDSIQQDTRQTENSSTVSGPITLTFYDGLNFDDPTFNFLFIEPLKKKFPQWTIEKKTGSITDLAAAGQVPDILFGGSSVINGLQKVDAVSEIADLIRSNRLDISIFDPKIMDTLQSFSVHGEQFGLPFNGDSPALFYNKDIFDKFGIPYPKGNLSWKDAIELGRKLTRNEAGTQYVGFYPGNWSLMGGQLALNRFDLQQKKATFTTDNYKRLFETLKEAYSVPGVPNIDYGKAKTLFYKDRTVAMYYIHLKEMVSESEAMIKADNVMNWDMLPMPTFDGLNNPIGVSFLMISTTSKQRQAAFEAISYLASDKEVQTMYSRSGRIPVLADTSLRKEFGSDLAGFKGKNIDFLSQLKFADSYRPTPYDSTIASPELNKVINRILNDGVDINTALSQAEEAATQKLRAELN